MIIVHYTLAKTIKGETLNVYKAKEFRDLSDAADFENTLKSKPNICNIWVFSK